MLAWMDLEMTGLEPSRHTIVEIATLVTDDDLAVVAEGPDIVVHASEAELAAMDPVVRAMHTRSGLLQAVVDSTVSLEEAGALTLAFLQEHLPAKTVPLCGNSIGTDRRFLAVQLPAVEQWLHYRSIDVSSVKELCRRWYPGVFEQAPAKRTTHRAMDDIRESVAELAYYRQAIFLPAPARPADVDATADGGATSARSTPIEAAEVALEASVEASAEPVVGPSAGPSAKEGSWL